MGRYSELEARINKIDELLELFQKIIVWLYHGEDKQAYGELARVMPELNEIIGQLINEIPYYREEGVDLPEDIILAQLQNLMEGIQYKDTVLLADALNFEISDTLMVYKEILMQL